MTPFDSDRVTRAIEAVNQARGRKEQESRVTRDGFVAEVLGCYGLPPEWADRITGERPGQIKAQARRLAVEYANTRSATEVGQPLTPTVQPDLISGERDFGGESGFDLTEVVRQVQHPY
jgi:hypothetical protein